MRFTKLLQNVKPSLMTRFASQISMAPSQSRGYDAEGQPSSDLKALLWRTGLSSAASIVGKAWPLAYLKRRTPQQRRGCPY